MNLSTRPVTIDEVFGLDRYERERDDIRRRIIAAKKNRRVGVGDCVTFIFENHDTVFFQIHEMLRAERITDLDAVREELRVYNELLPRPGGLSATMMIEITEQGDIEPRLLRLLGIDECVFLEVGSDRARGEFEPGRSREDRISAVQYVRFQLPPPAIAAFADDSVPVTLRIDHANYRAATLIEGLVRRALAQDLAS